MLRRTGGSEAKVWTTSARPGLRKGRVREGKGDAGAEGELY